MGDLIDLSESDMKAFWEHEDMKKLHPNVVYQLRFMKAWRELKGQEPSIAVPSTQPIIVLSCKEGEAMDKLQTALADIDQLMKQNVQNQSNLKEQTQRITKEI